MRKMFPFDDVIMRVESLKCSLVCTLLAILSHSIFDAPQQVIGNEVWYWCKMVKQKCAITQERGFVGEVGYIFFCSIIWYDYKAIVKLPRDLILNEDFAFIV